MKQQTIFIILALILTGTLIFLASNSGQRNDIPNKKTTSDTTVTPVQIVDGKQIIEVLARGGYSPRIITAKSGIPTILRMKTSSTFDCSAAFVIPSLKIQKLLPQTGTTDFDIPAQAPNSTIDGTCSMGMYSFKINFQ